MLIKALMLTGAFVGLASLASCSRDGGHPAGRRRKPADSGARPREGKAMTDFSEFTDTDWRRRLRPEQYRILRQKGTERAFSGKYWSTKDKGTYLCAACGQSLFSSDHKFDSGTGWPSYWRPVEAKSVGKEADNGLFTRRTEVHCSRCGGHLGHVFEDGPKPTGLRYCVNSAALDFRPEKTKKSP